MLGKIESLNPHVSFVYFSEGVLSDKIIKNITRSTSQSKIDILKLHSLNHSNPPASYKSHLNNFFGKEILNSTNISIQPSLHIHKTVDLLFLCLYTIVIFKNEMFNLAHYIS